MDADAVIARVRAVVGALDLLATLPIWTVDGPGEDREARLSPTIGPALPSEPYGYDDYDPGFFAGFDDADEAMIGQALDASFEAVVRLPPDTPGLVGMEDDPAVVTVQLGTPLPVGSLAFLWVARRAMHRPGQWVEERYWVCVDEACAPVSSQTHFGPLEPWSRSAWRREP